MKKVMSACVCAMFLFACNKKSETGAAVRAGAAAVVAGTECGKEIVTDQPVKVGETGMMLPAKSKLCFTTDNLEIRVELPAGFSFVSKEGVSSERLLPIYATYSCSCSQSGSACQVFYADGLGFGCLQSSCSGSCTGRFTYKGYSVDRVAYNGSTDEFFAMAEVQKAIAAVESSESYRAFNMYGMKFAVVNNEKEFLAKASCNCEGTQACKLKVVSLPVLKQGIETKIKIYFCEGGCNGCELTV